MFRSPQDFPTSRPGRGRRQHRRHPALLAAALVLLAAPGLRAAALLEPSYELAAGWNLIHVPVEPLEKDPQTALAALAWESLWTWLPAETETRGGRWLVHYQGERSFLNTLFRVTGPNSYLLLTRSAGTLRIRGELRPDRQALRGGAFQLFGPSLARSGPPTLASYFSRAGVKEHIGPAFELTGQSYRRVQDGDLLRAGAAYWLFPGQDIPAPDPLRLGAGLGGLRFNAQASLQEIVVDVGSLGGSGGGAGAASRQLSLLAVPSAGGAGTTDWLEFQKPDGTFAAIGPGVTTDVPPEQSMARVTFRARQSTVAAAGGASLAAVVELSAPEGKVMVGAELDVPGLRGTWLGEAAVAEVERPSFHGGGYAPAPAMPVSLILELPAAGASRLLPCLEVETSRDGRQISYRVEAALFHEPIALTGTVASDGKSGTLAGTAAMPAEHPLNPYRHRYHPEHGAGLALSRDVRLRLGATLPGQEVENPLATVGTLGGVYEEEIRGLTAEPIRVRGAFRLRRLLDGDLKPCTATTE